MRPVAKARNPHTGALNTVVDAGDVAKWSNPSNQKALDIAKYWLRHSASWLC
jgi:hypothetical protein